MLIASQGWHSLVPTQKETLTLDLRKRVPIELPVHIYREIAPMLKE
jgi:hypothetical protein